MVRLMVLELQLFLLFSQTKFETTSNPTHHNELLSTHKQTPVVNDRTIPKHQIIMTTRR